MSQNFTLEGHDLSDLFDLTKPPVSFADDCKNHIPEYGSLVYTVWNPAEEFIYVGIGGTGQKPDTPLEDRNPRSRISQHSQGRRSGDQFCIYVHDFFVLPQLIASGEYEPERGYLDRLTKEYIHEHLRYRFKVFQTEDSVQIVRHLETALKKGAFGFPPPFLNGSVG